MGKKNSGDDFVELSPLEAVHEAAQDLYSAGAMDKKTLREFDALCLPEVRIFKPREIQKIRTREEMSQGVFAKYLNISRSTVQKWEQGDKHPSGASLKLLNLVADKGADALV